MTSAWEYRGAEIEVGTPPTAILQVLNRVGRDGWELGGTVGSLLLLKRPKRPVRKRVPPPT